MTQALEPAGDRVAGDWRKPYRAGSVLLVVVLVAIAVIPLVILVFMRGCPGMPVVHQDRRPKAQRMFKVQPRVRVALAVRTRGGAALPIRVTGGYRLVDPATLTTLVRGARLNKSPVQALSNGIVISVPDRSGIRKTKRLPRIRIVPTRSGTLHVGGRRYRGVLDIIYKRGGRMTLVNELDIEEYVGGVVAAEMFYYWPREALRAQAVVARTYTLALVIENDGVRPQPEYDVECSYRTAQEYEGISGERPTSLEAVRSTRGLVLTHRGRVFRAYFSSCCGGHTEACGLIWDDYDTIPPLTGTTCDYCKHSKWFNWKRTVKLSDVQKALKRAGHDVGIVRDLKFADANGEGHVDQVTVRGSRRTLRMKGNDFRLAMGSMKLLSMNFKSKRADGGYELTGHGWGHGCGMCQYGARGMAQVLKGYKKILQYYYPETELWKVY